MNNDTEADISLLKPKVRALAVRLIEECNKQGFSIMVSRGFRSTEQQDKYYAQGRTKPGKIITNARGGFSFHNFGVAFDIRPVLDAENEHKREAFYRKAGEMGMALGLEWGGAWTTFVDPPHFQYTAGYSIEDFRNNAVDWSKFEA
ncbi:MAG: peptidase M15 [Candidatus Niyogibacteria bacterium CG10_big_fil_rev_8_21_14_0_10_46_36]|uniref:Peptidase M15 n=1 Tax=Candidatus Niyogibacteria bacterium CG10_big_fil_rev_8_21_14_0_10_46_36 TaxID=1974726 RepID=A0A2H0TE93_9BACT|nr:MAG: peptidase M15 [Candidatus Niyogibacteria bacterium CG10_big_fil_rev_8_21_14_0_10_46_36]